MEQSKTEECARKIFILMNGQGFPETYSQDNHQNRFPKYRLFFRSEKIIKFERHLSVDIFFQFKKHHYYTS